MNEHNQKPRDMFHKQDVAVYLANMKVLKDLNILYFRLHILEAIFKVLRKWLLECEVENLIYLNLLIF